MRLILFLLSCIFSISSLYADNHVLMRLHGSNTIGAKLAPELVEAWLYEQGYRKLKTRNLDEEEKIIIAQDENNQQYFVEIKSHGSSTGFKSLQNNQADIGMSSRPIKLKENNRLKRFGEMTREDAEFVIGLDGIAVIVNQINPISRLNKSQIKGIFSGEINRWEQLDTQLSGDIHVYARDNKSGTYDTFKALVLGKKTALVKQAKRYESNAHLSDDVSRDPMGIGFVGLAYVRNSRAIAVAEEGTEARMPGPFDVATEDYAIARRLYMYVPELHKNENVKSFIDFCLSEKGQNVVSLSGFIAQNIEAQYVELNDGLPEEYLSLTRNSKRLSLNFRFKKGSVSLDNKAKRDLQRLVNFLSKRENKNSKIMLFGFAETSETHPVFSLDLSTFRVDRVSDLLVQNGIDPVRVRSYGDALPVASNEDAGGRHKNRRVEVWLQ